MNHGILTYKRSALDKLTVKGSASNSFSLIINFLTAMPCITDLDFYIWQMLNFYHEKWQSSSSYANLNLLRFQWPNCWYITSCVNAMHQEGSYLKLHCRRGIRENMHNHTLSLMFASMRKSKIPAVISLLLGDGWHFHRHSSVVPSFSKVHDNCKIYNTTR